MKKSKLLYVLLMLLFMSPTLVGCEEEESEKEVKKETVKEKTMPNPNPDTIALLETERGVVKIAFYQEKAPNHVKNFIDLIKKGTYDGTHFHRVIREPEPFVVQGGDPYTKGEPGKDFVYEEDGSGKPVAGMGGPGYTIKAEFNDLKHLEGTVAMARSQDPNSAGSQFYICLQAIPHLDKNYTIFGKVIEGMEVVHKIKQGDKLIKATVQDHQK